MTLTLRYFTGVAAVLFVLVFITGCTNEAQDETLNDNPGLAEDLTEARMENGVQVIEITAGPDGYEPGKISLQADVPARLVFTRTIDSECLEQVQIPAYGVEKNDLPLNEPVSVEFTPNEAGEFTFVCGMNMVRGTMVVRM